MKNQPVKEFHYKNDGQDLQQSLLPIVFPKHPDLLDRIYNRYPFVSKVEIALVVLTTFEVLRSLFLSGCIVSIGRFFNVFRIHFFQHTEGGITYSAVKAKLETPTSQKEKPSWIKRQINKILQR